MSVSSCRLEGKWGYGIKDIFMCTFPGSSSNFHILTEDFWASRYRIRILSRGKSSLFFLVRVFWRSPLQLDAVPLCSETSEQYIHSIQNNLQKRTTSLQRTKCWVPSVSIIRRFYCICIKKWSDHWQWHCVSPSSTFLACQTCVSTYAIKINFHLGCVVRMCMAVCACLVDFWPLGDKSIGGQNCNWLLGCNVMGGAAGWLHKFSSGTGQTTIQ